MAYTYRSIEIGGTGVWTSQRLFDNGQTVVHQLLGVHAEQNFGGTHALTAKQLADLTCEAAAADFGGTFDSSNDPFEL